MKILRSISLSLMLIIGFNGLAQKEKSQKLMKDADMAKKKMMKTDMGLQTFFDNAAGYAIFPNVGEGALIVGGASGNGVVYENGSAIGMASLKKLDIGLQAGGQAVSEIVFFETEEALAKFKDNDFSFSAEATAVILKSGASKKANYSDGVVVFAMPKKGVMADLSVGGQKFTFKDFENSDEEMDK